ncbi:MAG TPA: type I methionyl aminopeptidase [Vicinamibacterales bacterium]|jgi:methionyl aminopeptidase|nr:type I methionyl aminopeptidase [Vicinamibacterales bacterium]
MSIESDRDWRGLRAVGRIVALTLDLLEREAAVGVTTAALDAGAAAFIGFHGAFSAPARTYGFPGTVLVSVNDAVVHGIPDGRALRDGDVVKFDVTLEKDGYVADAARTVVLGRGSERALALKACAEAAFARAMDVARAGALVRHVGAAIDAEVCARGFRVIRELGGHGVGRTIHEPPFMPNFDDHRQRHRLSRGLVVAIEPIIAAGAPAMITDDDGWTVRTKDASLTAHFEHTVAITDGRPILLTAA